MKKFFKILITALPTLLMIGLIPIIKDDYLLTLAYIVIIFIAFKIKKARENQALIFLFGFIIMLISEYIFISTGVEKFIRNSLFGIMPIWLPFLWAYGFVVISRLVKILENR